MRNLFLLAVGLLGPSGCEQRVSSDPPPATAENLGPATSSTALESLFAPTPTDAGPVVLDSSHALTVTLCSASPQACGMSDAGAPVEGSYHVVFGSGHGAIRSRGQAMTDLYEELRNRTALGQRLDAEPHATGDAGAAPRAAPTVKREAAGGSSDPIIQCAFRLLDLVDSVGEVTLDRVQGSGGRACLVSLGRTAEGASSQCLIDAPQQPHAPGRGGLQF
jgi:hypothetical protein